MGLFINFTAKNFAGTSQCNTADLSFQLVAGTVCFLIDLCLGRVQDSLTFNTGIALGLVHNFVTTLLRLRNDFARLLFGFVDDLLCTFFRQFLLVTTTFCSSPSTLADARAGWAVSAVAATAMHRSAPR